MNRYKNELRKDNQFMRSNMAGTRLIFNDLVTVSIVSISGKEGEPGFHIPGVPRVGPVLHEGGEGGIR